MQISALIALFASTASAAATPRQERINQNLIPPDFGITAGQGKDQIQPGSCVGANNQPIPCSCPPAPNDSDFLAKLTQALTQGFFPDESVRTPLTLDEFNDESDTSLDTGKKRATAMIQVIQSIDGQKGLGCPGVSVPALARMQQSGQVGGNITSIRSLRNKRRHPAAASIRYRLSSRQHHSN
ncbi:hypothetical protein MMYC01_201354 [Madurella mycetomatis]|uniref:Uncharacterized protein n=1 Tax=Madurella mycetomatis TaxID=100816 RepID=A0A175WFG5_9PEZI|nr:hypothetical protein MMYC01_201354 [Madurella mycetomatis]